MSRRNNSGDQVTRTDVNEITERLRKGVPLKIYDYYDHGELKDGK